jgi:hypothetical protein
MIIRLLEADTPPTAAETVAVFATEYVYEIVLTELGASARRTLRFPTSGSNTEFMTSRLMFRRMRSHVCRPRRRDEE